VRILHAVGDDTLGTARLFAGQLPDSNACYREMQSGKVPRYGRFVDAHNATCWRAFHSTEFAKALDRCPAVPVQTKGAPSAPAAAISSADPSPMRLVQRQLRRGY
jgi:hypothetical protein